MLDRDLDLVLGQHQFHKSSRFANFLDQVLRAEKLTCLHLFGHVCHDKEATELHMQCKVYQCLPVRWVTFVARRSEKMNLLLYTQKHALYFPLCLDH